MKKGIFKHYFIKKYFKFGIFKKKKRFCKIQAGQRPILPAESLVVKLSRSKTKFLVCWVL